MSKRTQLVSKTEFAKAIDVSKPRISQLIKEGLPVNPDGTINLARGKRWIAQNVDLHRREARKPSAKKAHISIGSASANRNSKLKWEARIRELEFRKQSGELVDRAATERFLFERSRAERDRWIGAVPRMAARLAADLDADAVKVFPALDRIIRDQMLELAATPLKALADA